MCIIGYLIRLLVLTMAKWLPALPMTAERTAFES